MLVPPGSARVRALSLRSLRRWVALGVLAWVGRAGAEPLETPRSAQQLWIESALTAAAFAGAAVIEGTRGEHGGRWDWEPGVDVSVRDNFNDSAARVSDLLGVTSMALPLAGQLWLGFDAALGNAVLMYSEAQAANLLLVTATKEIVRRPRPYTHSKDPEVQRFAREKGSEAYVSFYSGHASTAFTSAISGSLLYAARTREPWGRHLMWGTELLLASTTAQLRVRAGRHYRTDIWVGSAVGTAIGIAIPALHGVIPTLSASELGVAGGALLLGMVGGELIDPCRLLGCAGPDAEHTAEGSEAAGGRWSLAPFAGGPGLQFSTEW